MLRSKVQDKTVMAKVWLGVYFELNCDKIPNPSGGSDVWNLPANTTKKEVYRVFREYCTLKGYIGVSDSTLCKLWRKHYRHVKIPIKGRFKACDT